MFCTPCGSSNPEAAQFCHKSNVRFPIRATSALGRKEQVRKTLPTPTNTIATLAVAATYAAALLGSGSAHALTPEDIFRKTSSSIVVVIATNPSGNETSLGSGVAITSQSIATNCHVLPNDNLFDVLYRGQRHRSFLVAADAKRDVCILQSTTLSATPAEIIGGKQPSPGQRAYAIGAPSGLELTISEGLVSGLRTIRGQSFIQTSAAISPGSSGGGLFDDNGRLIGITTMFLKDAQNLNFAIPAAVLETVIKDARSAEARGREEMAESMTKRSLEAHAYDDTASFEGVGGQAAAERWIAAMSVRIGTRYTNDRERVDFLKVVHYESKRAGMDQQFILAVIDVASGFRKYAIGEAGAAGYMQVSPGWVKKIGTPEHNLFHLRTNLRYGCMILRYYIDTYQGNIYSALVQYRMQMLAGEHAAQKGQGVLHAQRETNFPEAVFTAWKTTWFYDWKETGH